MTLKAIRQLIADQAGFKLYDILGFMDQSNNDNGYLVKDGDSTSVWVHCLNDDGEQDMV